MFEYRKILATPLRMRQPDWRWAVAVEHYANPILYDPDLCNDTDLTLGIEFNRNLANYMLHPRESQLMFPELFEMYCIRTSNNPCGGLRWQLEAGLMTKETDERIAEDFHITGGPAVVRLYRKLFFDVRDFLDDPHFLLANVFGTCLTTSGGIEDCDLTWKMVAYQLGYDKLREFLKSMLGGRLSKELKSWLVGYTADRIALAGFSIVLDQRKLLNQQALGVVQTALQSWDIDRVGFLDNPGALPEMAAKRIMDMLQTRILDADLHKQISEIRGAIEIPMTFSERALATS